MLENSKILGVADVVGLADITKGNAKVNLIFVSELYNTSMESRF